MKTRLILTALTAFVAQAVSAQSVTDTVTTGAGYANQVWYSLANDDQASAAKNSWDIGFEINGFTSSIILNSALGDRLWVYPNGDSSEWGTALDTAGIGTWTALYNDETDWGRGAFNVSADPDNDFDLGWGVYNLNNHTVVGDSIFVIKLSSGTYKQLWIHRLASNTYTFSYADLDGSNTVDKTIAKGDFPGKNFGYFSLQQDQQANIEPANTDWDLLFCQYTTFNYTNPPTPQTVTGVLSNKGVEVAKAYPVNDVAAFEDYESQTFETTMSPIGWNWKVLNTSTLKYDVEDSTVYFVKDVNGDTWKLVFTGFIGSSAGQYMFSKEKLASATTGIMPSAQKELFRIYPNPSAGQASVVLDLPQSADVTVRVTDMKGSVRTISALPVVGGLNTYPLSLENLENGIYFVSVVHQGGIMTQRLVITR